MAEGRYVYCVVDSPESRHLDGSGVLGKPAYVIGSKDIGAVVSTIPFAEIEPSMDNILAHQRVVEASRRVVTTMPVKFGVIFKTEEGVKTLLERSHDEYQSKLEKLTGKDEFGVKVLFRKEGMQRIKATVERDSPEITKMKRSLKKSGQGASYFTQMKIDEAVRNQTYKKLDALSRKIHEELARHAEANAILKSEHEQILLNAAYLVRRDEGQEFLERAARLGRDHVDTGLIVHSSGPWAPYSFC
jgi:Gas vesicle synthesis protein GvpL/GvpF